MKNNGYLILISYSKFKHDTLTHTDYSALSYRALRIWFKYESIESILIASEIM